MLHQIPVNIHVNVEEEAPKPVGWMMCFLLTTLVLVHILNVLLYTYHVL